MPLNACTGCSTGRKGCPLSRGIGYFYPMLVLPQDLRNAVSKNGEKRKADTDIEPPPKRPRPRVSRRSKKAAPKDVLVYTYLTEFKTIPPPPLAPKILNGGITQSTLSFDNNNLAPVTQELNVCLLHHI